ncbi:hypothetical protein NP493_615g02013 [Ridgeia piscesae]|uniref:Uncharacterized protein n=1 Tax=Ridgeia piscesae TaxID=27915 RepID=A0AAD9KUV0_RIDPI|nr:hypothetical protein NP493_615g02013 [Ridgeia piscesae]
MYILINCHGSEGGSRQYPNRDVCRNCDQDSRYRDNPNQSTPPGDLFASRRTVRPRAVRMSIPSSRVADTARVLHLVTTRWTSGVEVGLRVIIRWTSGGVEPRQGTVRWSSEVVGALQLTVGWTSRVSESVWVMLGREITKDAVHQVAMASKVVEVSREVRRTTGRGQERQTRMTVVCPVIALVRTSLGQVRVTAKTRSWK